MVVNLDPSWSDLINDEWIRDLDNTEILKRCRNGLITKNELETFIIQHFFYSEHFVRFLSSLILNIDDSDDTKCLLENLCEEVGVTQNHIMPHISIYKEMMHSLGIDITNKSTFPETENLINSMLDFCKHKDPIFGLGALCLGAEAIVPHIYSQILMAFKRIGYNSNDLLFLKLHVECDDGHANKMKEIIIKHVSGDRNKLISIKKIGEKMIKLRIEFFNAIYSSCFPVQEMVA